MPTKTPKNLQGIPLELQGVFARLHNTQVEILPPLINYAEDAEDYQEEHEFDFPEVRAYYQHYKSGEVVRVVAIARADAFEDRRLNQRYVVLYRNVEGDLYYTEASEFAREMIDDDPVEHVLVPKRVKVKKPFRWTMWYSMFGPYIRLYQRFTSKVFSYKRVMRELDKSNGKPIYVVNNIQHFHRTGQVDLVIPNYRAYDQGKGFSEDKPLVVPAGWLPIDITRMASRESLRHNRHFKEMVASGNIGVISTWRAEHFLRSEEGKAEVQRRAIVKADIKSIMNGTNPDMVFDYDEDERSRFEIPAKTEHGFYGFQQDTDFFNNPRNWKAENVDRSESQRSDFQEDVTNKNETDPHD